MPCPQQNANQPVCNPERSPAQCQASQIECTGRRAECKRKLRAPELGARPGIVRASAASHPQFAVAPANIHPHKHRVAAHRPKTANCTARLVCECCAKLVLEKSEDATCSVNCGSIFASDLCPADSELARSSRRHRSRRRRTRRTAADSLSDWETQGTVISGARHFLCCMKRRRNVVEGSELYLLRVFLLNVFCILRELYSYHLDLFSLSILLTSRYSGLVQSWQSL